MTKVERKLRAGTLARLAPGWWVGAAGTAGDRASFVLGEDLLWHTGSFEDMAVARFPGPHLWSLGADARTSADACSRSVGVEIGRRAGSRQDVIVSPLHRQLVTAGDRVSLVAGVRAASPGSTLELRWYKDTKGGSSSSVKIKIPRRSLAGKDCEQVRIDAIVPPGVVAAQPFVRLAPSADGYLRTRLAVDDIQLLSWAEPGMSGRRYDTVDARADVRVPLFYDGDGSAAPDPFAN